MAALVNILKFTQSLNRIPANAYIISRKSHWNKDWKPGPYPRTPEEREAAAKKYGLAPSEYQPYPDDGLGHGDYPQMRPISAESKDPDYAYDFPEHKRNFNEPLHVDADIYGQDRYDISGQTRYSMSTYLLMFLGVMGGSFLLYFYLEDKKMFRPVLPKQYPRDSQEHYTFKLD